MKVIILFASRKGGHRYPSEAVAKELQQQSIEAKVYNLLDYLPVINFVDKIGRWGDLHLRGLWRTSYKSLKKSESESLFSRLWIKIIGFVFGLHQRRIKRLIGKVDYIISFQPEINCAAKYLKGEVPFYTMIMDYVIHRGWVGQGVDFYFVGNEIVQQELIQYGVSQQKILVTGVPAQWGFQEVLNKEISEQRKELGLKDGFTVLLMAGYLGQMVDYTTILQQLSQLRIQILVVTGRNKLLYDQLKKLCLTNTHLYYNVPSIHPIMYCADIVISKPGGMVIADALTLGKPMILVDPEAGSLQEILFAECVENQGAAIHLKNAKGVSDTVKRLLNNPAELESMRKKARVYGEKNRKAAKMIVENIVSVYIRQKK